MTAPTLTPLATLEIEVAAPIVVGDTAEGVRRVIPITGGRAEGPELRGTILPGGADFQLLRSDTLAELEAKYVLETDAGEQIFIDNRGLRSASAEDSAAIARGEAVPPERVYFRSVARLSGGGERWRHLEERIIVGVGQRLPDRVLLELFVVE